MPRRSPWRSLPRGRIQSSRRVSCSCGDLLSAGPDTEYPAPMQDHVRTLITGASSGIGAALAKASARPGASLHLAERDAARLDAVTGACRASGATVRTTILDVRDADAMATWIHNAGHLDLVVANAGISAGTAGGVPDSHEQARAIF